MTSGKVLSLLFCALLMLAASSAALAGNVQQASGKAHGGVHVQTIYFGAG